MILRCASCHGPLARVVRNDDGLRTEVGEPFTIQVKVWALDGASVRDSWTWWPLFGLQADQQVATRCTCTASTVLSGADLLRLADGNRTRRLT